MIDYYNQGKINETTYVACSGMKQWQLLSNTELWQYLDDIPDIEESIGVTKKWVLTYIVIALISFFLYATTDSAVFIGINWVAAFIFLTLDIRAIHNKRWELRGSWEIWAYLFTPVYLFKRAKKLEEKNTYAVIFLVLMILIAFVGSARLAGNADGKAKKDVQYKTNTSVSNFTETKQSDPTDSYTMGQKQALRKAEEYLSVMAFSKASLYEQLVVYDKFSKADAEFAVNNIDTDWKEQAAKKAEEYLSVMSFSRDELLNQLITYDKFNQEEAEYGISKVYGN